MIELDSVRWYFGGGRGTTVEVHRVCSSAVESLKSGRESSRNVASSGVKLTDTLSRSAEAGGNASGSNESDLFFLFYIPPYRLRYPFLRSPFSYNARNNNGNKMRKGKNRKRKKSD